MLILARKVGQKIIIGEDIEITIIEVRGDQVRLGIKAPRSVPVSREELRAQISAENVEAASLGPQDLEALFADDKKEP